VVFHFKSPPHKTSSLSSTLLSHYLKKTFVLDLRNKIHSHPPHPDPGCRFDSEPVGPPYMRKGSINYRTDAEILPEKEENCIERRKDLRWEFFGFARRGGRFWIR